MSLDHYHTLGKSGLKVSRLALGTMTFGTEWGWGCDREAAERIFDIYLDRGGNFLDTADLYTGGTSESWLGAFIAERAARDRVVIATKFGFNAQSGNPNAGGNGRKNILRAVEGYLSRLEIDVIGLYFLHAWDRLTPVEEVMRTFDDLVRAGKVRHVGLSNVPAWYASRAQALAEFRGSEPVIALQMEYSLIERSIEHEFVPLATRHGMGIMAWSPLASGLLAGKYRPGLGGPEGEGRVRILKDSTNPGFAKLRDPRHLVTAALVAEVAREVGCSPARVALNWVAKRPGVGAVVIGATRPEQLEDNLGALDITLPPETLERLDAAHVSELPYPHTFFGAEIQMMVSGGTTISA